MKARMSYLLIFILTYGALVLGGLITRPALMDWYPTLTKPSFTPPNWVFPVAWNLLYLLLASATCRLWAKAHTSGLRQPLTWYGLQLGLNVLWSTLYFGMHQIGWALAEILAMWVLAWPFAYSYWKRDKVAALGLVPYLGWLTFACLLNLRIWQLNP